MIRADLCDVLEAYEAGKYKASRENERELNDLREKARKLDVFLQNLSGVVPEKCVPGIKAYFNGTEINLFVRPDHL